MPIIVQPRAFVPTPSSILASSPCLPCFSDSEMIALLVAIFALSAGKTVSDVMKDSACFDCLTEKQMLQALVTFAGNDLLGEEFTTDQILATMKCIRRCSSRKALLGALVYLLANDIKLADR